MSEKTEEPTPRRLKKARGDGDSPVSTALIQAAAFLVTVAVAPGLLSIASSRIAGWMIGVLQNPTAPADPRWVAVEVVRLSLPLVAAAAAAAALVGLVQSGGVLAVKKMAPDLSRANPIKGLKNLFTVQRLISVARALATAMLIGYLGYSLVLDHIPDLARTIARPEVVGTVASTLLKKLAWIAVLVGIALGGIDLLVVRRGWMKRLRMSKDEVKREHKEAEGDPEIKAARKRAHEEALRGSTVALVRRSTVVVVNPTHLATALRYDEERGDAPEVLANGRGDLAALIIEAARAYGVPVVRDVPLARALGELEPGDEIPEALYEAVAGVLREVWDHAEGQSSE